MGAAPSTRPRGGRAARARDATGTLRVAWLGRVPDWLEGEEARAVLGACLVGGVDSLDAIGDGAFDVVHVAATGLRRPLVVERDGETPPGRRERRALARARTVVVPTLRARRALSYLGDRVAVVRRPVDLARHAPAAELLERERRDYSRFLRFHRLGPPAVLFAGPYTEEGGLHGAIDAALRLRERLPDVRLAAIPLGPVDPRYRDRCERAALALGHRGIVEWQPPERELPYWFAAATALAVPYDPGGDDEAQLLAGAAGVPAVAADGGEALAAALGAVLDDEERAAALGTAARRTALATLAPAHAASLLADAWRRAAQGT